MLKSTARTISPSTALSASASNSCLARFDAGIILSRSEEKSSAAAAPLFLYRNGDDRRHVSSTSRFSPSPGTEYYEPLPKLISGWSASVHSDAGT
jgi:hypothetical protein